MTQVEDINKLMPWQDNVVFCAQRYSKTMESQFVKEWEKITRWLPAEGKSCVPYEEQIRFGLENMMEYSIGTLVAILTEYVNDTPEFEEAFVAMARDKFVAIREIREKAKLV